jgi:hypothetical protein
MDKNEPCEAESSLLRSKTKMTSLDRLLERYLDDKAETLDAETQQLLLHIRMIEHDIAAELETTGKALCGERASAQK